MSVRRLLGLFVILTALIIVVIAFSVRREDNLWAKAKAEADTSKEAYFRLNKYLDIWTQAIDPATGLFPKSLKKNSGDRIWLPKDNAADNYPYMVLSANMIRPDLIPVLKSVLNKEKSLTSDRNGLVRGYDIDKRTILNEDTDTILLHNAEYLKDSLMPITDQLGPSPWFDRAISLTDALLKDSDFTNIVDDETRVNDHITKEIQGDMLQVLCRLYWLTGERAYLDQAIDIGDYYLLDKHLSRSNKMVTLRDHGDELIAGLSELYFTLSYVDQKKKIEYEKPLHELLDDLLAYGRNEHGLFYEYMFTSLCIDCERDSVKITDNWGYIANAFFTVYLVDHTETYKEAVTEIFKSLAAYYNRYDWEPPNPHDGYADSLEGAMELLSFMPSNDLNKWVDSNMNELWKLEDQLIESGPDYLHGNIARTTMMYAMLESRGIRLSNWQEGLGVGAVEYGDGLLISISTDSPWSGTISFPADRFKTIWNMPAGHPRINTMPQWFMVDPAKTYRLKNISSGEDHAYTGNELVAGVAISTHGNDKLTLTEIRLPQAAH